MDNVKTVLREGSIALLALAYAFTIDATVVTYPAPSEARLNRSFSVEVRQSGTLEWQPVDIYAVKVDRTEGVKHSAATVSMAYFDFDGKVDVRVTSNEIPVKEASVRPLSYDIPIDIQGNSFTFSLDTPRNLSVEVNGEIFNNLQLFANPLDINRPSDKELRKLKKDKKYYYYGPGYYNIGTLNLGSGETLYVAGGAVLDGDVQISGADGV
ncbi:MAG: endo-polygalacturonase, partial [Muribaculaceae bacterium]|nr:endo-polygalacturonase [Muribaculaceae bacterium]